MINNEEREHYQKLINNLAKSLRISLLSELELLNILIKEESK
jgi:hypothetical protein